ncbi:MAG: hypothetical protein [Bacteriophage sp.]|nr:MAG: hypothetical protein [Bacteriophage sp.]
MKPYKQYFMYLNGELEHVFKKNIVPNVEMVQDVLIDVSGLYECAVRQSVTQIDKNLRSGYGLNGIDVRLEIMERPRK